MVTSTWIVSSFLDSFHDLTWFNTSPGEVRGLPGFVYFGAGWRSHYVGAGLFAYHCVTDQTARYQPRIHRATCTRLCARRRNHVGAA